LTCQLDLRSACVSSRPIISAQCVPGSWGKIPVITKSYANVV